MIRTMSNFTGFLQSLPSVAAQLPWATIGISCGPLAASMLARLLFGRNPAMLMCVRAASAWLAIKVLIVPMIHMAQGQTGYLVQLTGN